MAGPAGAEPQGVPPGEGEQLAVLLPRPLEVLEVREGLEAPEPAEEPGVDAGCANTQDCLLGSQVASGLFSVSACALVNKLRLANPSMQRIDDVNEDTNQAANGWRNFEYFSVRMAVNFFVDSSLVKRWRARATPYAAPAAVSGAAA